MEGLVSRELESFGEPSVVIDSIRHGEASYTDEERRTGELEGHLTKGGIEQIKASTANLVNGIDPEKELVVMWVSPKNRAIESAKIIEGSLFSQGIVPFRAKLRKSLSNVELFGYSKDVDEAMNANSNKYWMEVWENLKDFPKEVESPGDVMTRTNRVLTFINRIAEKIKLEGGKRWHFILVNHEETLQGLLEKSFGIGASKGEGQQNGEVVRLALYKSPEGSSNTNPRLSVFFGELTKVMRFDPQKREVLAE